MSPDRHQRIKELFLGACALPEHERAAYLHNACPDAELRAEVESLLAHHRSETIIEQSGELTETLTTQGQVTVIEAKPAPALAAPRFQAGSVVAERYRIVTLLGRGGMGEVYRADDLKLNRPVALKFMIRGHARDGAWLARFYQEARLSLSITHPNICRVYDIGEAQGEAFISMEYVDGEDLKSLLLRVGRLSQEKTVEVTRQLCAGLGSAHAQGVLHRDLKPANVMIDSRGRVRITDFGIAVADHGAGERHATAGTPSYMAPELLAGGAPGVVSDLYAVGLIMYEMLTGRRVFAAGRQRTPPDAPSTFDPHVAPALEQLVLRCLQEDPRRRPQSAYELRAGLPGGDPLAEALAAGETPPPEMVAAAGGAGRLRPRIALTLGIFTIAVLVAVVLLSGRTLLLAARLDKSPYVLEERAREILRDLDGSRERHDGRGGFAVMPSDPTRQLLFEYRLPGPSSGPPTPFRPPTPEDSLAIDGGLMRLAPTGRLLFYVSPSHVLQPADAQGPEPAWDHAARWMGLSLDALQPDTPMVPPPVYADALRAWKGKGGTSAGDPVQMVIGAVGPRIVYCQLLDSPGRAPGASGVPGNRSGLADEAIHILFLVALAGGAALAWRNVRSGRVDWRGARRVGMALFALEMLIWFAAHSFSTRLPIEARHLTGALQTALFTAGSVWILYVGLEPYVRKLWPQAIISWSRLLDGRLRDPLVGRDLLVGTALGAAIVLLQQINVLLGSEPQLLMPAGGGEVGYLLGLQHNLHVLSTGLRNAVIMAMVLLMLMLLLRLVLRAPAAAGAAFLIVVTVVYTLVSPASVFSTWITSGIIAGGTALVLLRSGFLATAASFLAIRLLLNNPLTCEPRFWGAGTTVFVLAVLLLPVAFGLYTHLGRARTNPAT